MNDIKSIRIFEDDVTWPGHALVIHGGWLGGGGWVGEVMDVIWRLFASFLRTFAFFELFEYLDQGSSAFLSCAFDCECNRPSVVATVFDKASSFNGDLNKWDVAKVTDMSESKSKRVVESDLTWRNQRMWFVTNGDIVTRSPSDIFCLVSVVRFPYGISCLLALVQNTVVIE